MIDWSALFVGVLAFIGTLAGTYSSNNKTTALILYRIQALEEKQSKHNHVIERTYHLEEEQAVMKEQIRVANHRITDLENKA